MAVLDPVYWEAVSPVLQKLLVFCGKHDFVKRFYLAGGTGLALRLGHRRSIDLDFFSQADEVHYQTRQEVIRAFTALAAGVVENTDGNLLLLVEGVHVGFFGYGYSLLEPTEEVEGVQVASLVDIGLMKLDALIGRGSRKDFYDVYAVDRKIPLADLLEKGKEKYPYVRDFALMAVESMLLFENADRDRQPELLVNVPWDEVRQYFLEAGKTLGEKWFRE